MTSPSISWLIAYYIGLQHRTEPCLNFLFGSVFKYSHTTVFRNNKDNLRYKQIILNTHTKLTVGPSCDTWQSLGTEFSGSSYLYGGAGVKAKWFGLPIFQIDFQDIWHKKKWIILNSFLFNKQTKKESHASQIRILPLVEAAIYCNHNIKKTNQTF